MANNVFANMMELSCKAGAGKSICCFPDVCMTPPENPATPPGIPIPYPNTGMASDTSKGSRSVKITGKEVTLKNSSNFKRTMGDEAGCAAKKGVISSKNMGKAFFNAWSMDVKIEGKNAVRMLDLMTHNHGSPMNTGPWPFIDTVAAMSLIRSTSACADQVAKIEKACDPIDEKKKCPDSAGVDAAKAEQKKVQAKTKDPAQRKLAQEIVNISLEQFAEAVQEDKCLRAMRCALSSHSAGSKNPGGTCCPPQTPEHLIPASQFGKGRGKGHAKYSASNAACMCAEGGSNACTHGLLGRKRREYMDERGIDGGQNSTQTWKVKDSAACGASAASAVEPQCDEECIKQQLINNHMDMGISPNEEIRTVQGKDGQDLDHFGASYIPGEGIGG